jgi:hypothetical protein
LGARAGVVKEIAKHYDLMGKQIVEGAFVVAELNRYRNFELCVVDKVNPKMLRLRAIMPQGRSGAYYTANKYPAEMMVVDNEDDVTMYILRNSTKND